MRLHSDNRRRWFCKWSVARCLPSRRLFLSTFRYFTVTRFCWRISAIDIAIRTSVTVYFRQRSRPASCVCESFGATNWPRRTSLAPGNRNNICIDTLSQEKFAHCHTNQVTDLIFANFLGSNLSAGRVTVFCFALALAPFYKSIQTLLFLFR